MKLYFAPGACSLADRIALHEGKFTTTFEKVDLKSKRTETGADFTVINPKGYVPVLVLNDGQMITENIAILYWIANEAYALMPSGPLGHIRLLETLAFISTEIHKGFKPFFLRGAPDEEKTNAAGTLSKRLEFVAGNLKGPYLFGRYFSAADAYLFVTLRWAKQFGVPLPDRINEYFQNVMGREAVRRSLAEEGFIHDSTFRGTTTAVNY